MYLVSGLLTFCFQMIHFQMIHLPDEESSVEEIDKGPIESDQKVGPVIEHRISTHCVVHIVYSRGVTGK